MLDAPTCRKLEQTRRDGGTILGQLKLFECLVLYRPTSVF